LGPDLLAAPPWLTGDRAGIGGRLKAVPEDFEVEEIPAYRASGHGEFLFLWVEKRDMGAEYFQRHIARRLDIAPGEVGTAGLKDRHAVTRQMVSVPCRVEDRVRSLDGEGVRVLGVERHDNKLKPGHLHGNRFSVLIRDVAADAGQQAEPIIKQLLEEGLPNFYGRQRFGRDGETLRLGLEQLSAEATGGKPRRLSPFLRKLALSAAQSGLFNLYLSERLRDGLFRNVLPGDVLAKWPFGGMFVAEDVPREQERFDRGEIVSAGPIFGKKTFPARDEAARREAMVLEECGLGVQLFRGFGKLLQGSRRHNLVYPTDLRCTAQPDGLQLEFVLPAGSYATVLLGEIMKTSQVDDKADD
jgi:tRNA pseudouridine13 synthase